MVMFSSRPEFNRPQHNPTNPALVELRGSIKIAGPEGAPAVVKINLTTLRWDVEEHEDETGWRRYTPETLAYITHARKVLTRLANLTNDKEN